MNKLQFKQAAGISDDFADRWYQHIVAAFNEFSITSPADKAMFIAQVGHESSGFSRIVESLNYTPVALTTTFGTHRITKYQADMLGRTPEHPANQEAIANLVYGGDWGKKNLGNQNNGDGWKYRGRGLIQITGLSNYKSCGLALNLDLIRSPELLQQSINAVRSAAWFYVSRGCLSHSSDINKVTRIINGGLNGLADRQQRLNRARAALL